MAKTQKYGIKYPFTSDNMDNIYLDVNETFSESIKSQVLHLILTVKGQKIRDPEFGTSLIRYIFSPNDDMTIDNVKFEIINQISKYIPNVIFDDIVIYRNDEEGGEIIVSIKYSVRKGNKMESTTVAVKL